MSSFILIHGGGHAAWCWDPVVEPLRSAGHEVQALDLPGRDSSAAGGSDVTLEDWVGAVSKAVDATTSPPLLVAHSMGGISASQLAERRPDDIAGIVYVCAVVPVDGAAGLPTLMQAGDECALLVEGAMMPSTDGTTISVDPRHARIAFYEQSPEPAVRAALSRLCAESVPPMMTPLRLGANFARVSKRYIGASRDKAVPPAFQRLMTERCGAAFIPIDADHSPFYSAPEDFVALLLAIADSSRA